MLKESRSEVYITAGKVTVGDPELLAKPTQCSLSFETDEEGQGKNGSEPLVLNTILSISAALHPPIRIFNFIHGLPVHT